MTKIASSTRCWIGAVALAAGLLGAGEARAQGLICPAVPPAIPTFNPISCTVNCAQGGTIASALSLRARSTNNFTITINGTCVESVDDVPSGVTLQAGMSGATLQAPSSTTDPVLGISGIGVTLTGLTISGGVNALRGRSGAAFTGNNLLIEGASNADVLLNHAVVTLNTSTIQNSAGNGINANYNSTIFLNGGIIQTNSGWGVSAFTDGSIQLSGGVLVQKNTTGGAITGGGSTIYLSGGSVSNNAGPGFKVWLGGNVDIDGMTAPASVLSNGSDGVQVYQSTAIIRDGANIAGNAGNGVFLSNGANVVLFGGGIIQSNTGDGVLVDNGNLQVGGEGSAIIENNHGNGIFQRTNSVGWFVSPSNQITGNSGWGILCTGAPSNPMIFGTVGTVSGNGAGNISCNVSP